MNEISRHILIVLLPLVLSNILHMLVVKFNYLSKLNVPLSVSAFGKNKTWRGFIFVPLANAVFLILIDFVFHLEFKSPVFTGIIMGLAYVTFELPNSFLKRRLGIQSGAKHNKFKIFFSLLDKMDSAFGVAFIYLMLGYVDYRFAVLLFVVNSLTHIVLSQLLVQLKIKSTF